MNSCMSGMSSARLKESRLLICWPLLAGGEFCSKARDLLLVGKHWWLLQMLKKEQHIRCMCHCIYLLLTNLLLTEHRKILTEVVSTEYSVVCTHNQD